jgi:hypothetical protein
MTLVAAPYSIAELGEDEEGHDTTAKFLSRATGTLCGSSAARRMPRDLPGDGAAFSSTKRPKRKSPNDARQTRMKFCKRLRFVHENESEA